MEKEPRESIKNADKIPTFLSSLLLSLPVSIGLPYIFLGLSFKFTTCRGGMFCLPTGLECLTILGFVLFAFPFLIALMFMTSLIYAARIEDSVEIASFTAQPVLPFAGFAMLVNPTHILSLLPQVLFWAMVVHWIRIKLRKR